MDRQPVTRYYSDHRIELHHANVSDGLPLADESVDCVVTSPPYYGLRDYGVEGQLGSEATPGAYVRNMRHVFADVRRVLAEDGTLWLNIGDSYGKGKQLRGMPWRVALALQSDGWILRNAVIWNKTNAVPDPTKDRLAPRYETVFMFAKSARYHFDLTPIRVPHETPGGMGWAANGKGTKITSDTGRYSKTAAAGQGLAGINSMGGHPDGKNPGDVWPIPTGRFRGSHFAVFPPELPRRCIVAGCKPGGTVLDPFHGSGTTGKVALENGRKYVGVELNREYLDLSMTTRLADFVTVGTGEAIA